jgi:hypothetical protein
MKRIRVKKDNNFSVINNEFIFNKNMSLKAKGLLCHLLALPNDWDLYVEEVEKWHKDGKKAIYSAFKELKVLGYVDRIQKREKGKIVKWDYIVYEKPLRQKLHVQKVQVENAPLINTNNKLNTNNNKTKGFQFETLEELNVEVWKKWREYRTQQFRTSYKPIGEKAAIGKLLRISHGCHKVQEQIIQQSIENGWKGLFEIKQEKQSKIKQSLNTWSEARKLINNG